MLVVLNGNAGASSARGSRESQFIPPESRLRLWFGDDGNFKVTEIRILRSTIAGKLAVDLDGIAGQQPGKQGAVSISEIGGYVASGIVYERQEKYFNRENRRLAIASGLHADLERGPFTLVSEDPLGYGSQESDFPHYSVGPSRLGKQRSQNEN
jgi:hypothetical protein